MSDWGYSDGFRTESWIHRSAGSARFVFVKFVTYFKICAYFE